MGMGKSRWSSVRGQTSELTNLLLLSCCRKSTCLRSRMRTRGSLCECRPLTSSARRPCGLGAHALTRQSYCGPHMPGSTSLIVVTNSDWTRREIQPALSLVRSCTSAPNPQPWSLTSLID